MTAVSRVVISNGQSVSCKVVDANGTANMGKGSQAPHAPLRPNLKAIFHIPYRRDAHWHAGTVTSEHIPLYQTVQ